MAETNYSVLMSVYIKESPDYFKQSLDSILGQTVPSDDIVIIKDGPQSPEVEKLLSEYAERFPAIHIYGYEKNMGLGHALNTGLTLCKNELVARMDTDDIAFPERCEKQLAVFAERPELDIVGSSLVEFIGTPDNLVAYKHMPAEYADILKYAKRRNPFNHPTVMYKRHVVIESGGYEECSRAEDFGLFTKMVFEGRKGYNLPEPLLKYRADANMIKRRQSKPETKVVIRIAKRNYKCGYIGWFDYAALVLMQMTNHLLPTKIAGWIFRHRYRTPIQRQKQ